MIKGYFVITSSHPWRKIGVLNQSQSSRPVKSFTKLRSFASVMVHPCEVANLNSKYISKTLRTAPEPRTSFSTQLDIHVENVENRPRAWNLKSRFYVILQFHFGGDLDSTPVLKPEVHVERVVTLVNQLLQLL